MLEAQKKERGTSRRIASADRSCGRRVRIYFGEDARGSYVSLSDGQSVIATEYGQPKEDLIAVMDRAFQHTKKDKSDIKEVAVDRGPGGFSAVRRRVAIAASLALSLDAAIAECGGETAEQAALLPSDKFSARGTVTPLYLAEPNITTPRRSKGAMGDALRSLGRRRDKNQDDS